MREGGRRRRVGVVVRRDEDRLDGGDGARLGGGDAFLQRAHFGGQRRLVAHRRWHSPEKGGALRAGERVAVDVVDEEQHVAPLVAKLLGQRQAGQAHAQTVAGRLVHLPEDQRDLVEDACLLHLVVEVVALPGAFADTGENRQAGVLDGDVADQFEHGHRLADTGPAEQAHLPAAGERAHQVDDLDAGLKQFVAALLVLVGRRLAVDRQRFAGVDRSFLIDRVAEDVQDAAERLLANRNGDRATGVDHVEPAGKAFGRPHGDRAHDAIAELLLHLEGQAGIGDLQRVVHVGHCVSAELGVDHRADDLNDSSV